MRARLIQARTKKLLKQKKRNSWKNYVSSVNVNTPSKKVWDMICKITGKNVASPMLLKKVRPPTITLKSSNLSRHQKESKRSTLRQTEIFVIIRSLRWDLKRSLKKSNNSSPGPDQIHFEILRHYWDSSYIIGHHKWNMEKWHISGIMERGSDYFNSKTRKGSF